MVCPRCGRSVNASAHRCPFCDAMLVDRLGATGGMGPNEKDAAFQTEVLSSSYDYEETIVDSVAFDPSFFSDNARSQEIWGADSVGGYEKQLDPEQKTWVLSPTTASENAVSNEERTVVVPVQEAPSSAVGGHHAIPSGGSSPAWQAPPRPSPYQREDEKASTNRMIIGVIIALALVAIAGLAICLVALLGADDNTISESDSVSSSKTDEGIAEEMVEGELAGEDESNSQDSTVLNGASQGVTPVPRNDSPGSGSNTGGLTDSQAYKLLVSYYNEAGDYDASIASCARDFNATWLDESKQTRTANASKVSTLKRQVKSSWDAIQALDMPFWSANMNAWKSLCECYECLYRRIDVIDRAWAVDLSYDKPQKNESAIKAPLKAQQGSDGVDKYYARFKSLYPTITFVNPTRA